MSGSVFDVKTFGAVGDGQADDTAAFLRALDAIEALHRSLMRMVCSVISAGPSCTSRSSVTFCAIRFTSAARFCANYEVSGRTALPFTRRPLSVLSWRGTVGAIASASRLCKVRRRGLACSSDAETADCNLGPINVNLAQPLAAPAPGKPVISAGRSCTEPCARQRQRQRC